MIGNKHYNRALKMRKAGSSFADIFKVVPVSRSTLGRWFRGVLLSTDQYVRIGGVQDSRGISRSKAADSLRLGRVTRETRRALEADDLFDRYQSDPLFLMGVAVYWLQGAKSGLAFQLTSSDDQLIFFMSRWADWYMGYPLSRQGFRLYVYDTYKSQHLERVWAGRLGVSVDRIRVTLISRKAGVRPVKGGYKGSIRIELGEIRAHQLTMRWQKRLIPLILSATGPHSLMDKVTDFGSVDLGSIPGGGT
jgi:hypothetical protein